MKLAVRALCGEAGRERSASLSFGIRYGATRSVTLGCDVTHPRRTSDTVLSTTYPEESISCTGRVATRWRLCRRDRARGSG